MDIIQTLQTAKRERDETYDTFLQRLKNISACLPEGIDGSYDMILTCFITNASPEHRDLLRSQIWHRDNNPRRGIEMALEILKGFTRGNGV